MSALHPRFSYPAAAFGLALLVAVPTGGTALQLRDPGRRAAAATGQAQVQGRRPGPNAQRQRPPRPFWEWEWWKDADVQKELGAEPNRR